MSHPYPTHFSIFSSCCLAGSKSRAFHICASTPTIPFPHSLKNSLFLSQTFSLSLSGPTGSLTGRQLTIRTARTGTEPSSHRPDGPAWYPQLVTCARLFPSGPVAQNTWWTATQQPARFDALQLTSTRRWLDPAADPRWAVGNSRITHESMLEADLIASKAGSVMQVDVPCTAQHMRAAAYTIRPPDPGCISAWPKPWAWTQGTLGGATQMESKSHVTCLRQCSVPPPSAGSLCQSCTVQEWTSRGCTSTGTEWIKDVGAWGPPRQSKIFHQPLVEGLSYYTEQGWVVHVFPLIVGIRGMIDSSHVQSLLKLLEIQW